MRKLVAWELISVDGVMETPEQWASSFSDDEMNEANATGMANSDALLLGRKTYESLAAFWPNQPGGTPMVDHINSVRKFVVSTTLEDDLEWNNSSLIGGGGGNVAREIAELKRQPGKGITVLGSGVLVRSLLGEGLLDELTLMVHPLVLGSGKRLFDVGVRETLELVDATAFGSGVVSLVYRPSAG
ncbi:MAG TPA: dihydrofolate reductase family protein [Rubrobacter sp.]|nr:dihydrofolate reductase family protein [Rubrobacter sp.]